MYFIGYVLLSNKFKGRTIRWWCGRWTKHSLT